VSFLWWCGGVYDGATMSLQQAFHSSPPKYDIDSSFVIVNYCYFFALFIVDAFFNHIIK
jgi:hypothetical protein